MTHFSIAIDYTAVMATHDICVYLKQTPSLLLYGLIQVKNMIPVRLKEKAQRDTFVTVFGKMNILHYVQGVPERPIQYTAVRILSYYS